uniref:non-specific serine/threonine protein kinase n=1 Tax=Ditylenchus dipsaci TaxID=166011 RepID=A0A915DHA7_9BILA
MEISPGMTSAEEDDPARKHGGFKTHNLSLTIGSGEDEDEEEEEECFDMRSRMQSFALDDGFAMPPTIFVDDSDVMLLPTTSSSLLQEGPSPNAAASISAGESSNADMENFVKDFFTSDVKLFQPPDEGNFVEEIFTEKQPKFIGDYLFGNVIGEGSYSKVKEVLHTRLLVRRAVKIIKDKRLRKIPGGEQNVQREIEVLKRVRHINVVELFEVFRVEEKQKLYIVMEFCVCSLQQMLDNCVQKKLPEFQAHLYFAQMIDGLDYLHSQGIIHKDIKPGNLLLSLDGKIKICDMGVAEVLHDGDPSADVKDDWCTIAQGTPKFQPPEVVSGTYKRFRGRLWEYPFEGDVIMKLFENITTQPLSKPVSVEISASLMDLLEGLLQKNPDNRWSSARIRQSEWFLEEHPIPLVDEFDKEDWPLLQEFRFLQEQWARHQEEGSNYSSLSRESETDVQRKVSRLHARSLLDVISLKSTWRRVSGRIVHVPEMRNIAAHCPLGVFHSLEQLYDDGEEDGGEGSPQDTKIVFKYEPEELLKRVGRESSKQEADFLQLNSVQMIEDHKSAIAVEDGQMMDGNRPHLLLPLMCNHLQKCIGKPALEVDISS